jgi:putative methyltransferase (TIGR04325 family)
MMRKVMLRGYAQARRLFGASQPLRGRFPNWEAACRESTGYDQPVILERLIKSTDDVVRSGGRLHERDGVVFTEPVTPFPLLAFLLLVAGKTGGRLNVLDFGGGFGSTYRQCLPFLAHLPHLQWDIVEQEAVVAAGRERFTTERLRFHSSVDEVASERSPDIVIFSGVLQYLENPYGALASTVACKPSMIVIDRNPFWDGSDDVFSLQMVSDEIFPARLPFRIFGRDSIEKVLEPAYRTLSPFGTVDPDMMVGSDKVRFRGKAFERVSGIQQD